MVPPRVTFRSGRWLLAALLAPIAVAHLTSADETGDGRPAQSAAADDLLIVHCSLPGQIRQLGRHSTYLSARQPVRTTALDCRVRGGEYVVHDRASLKTALNVWLEKAQAGDPDAETTVGEIFEQGLGVPPDHATAARWYQRAAEDGFERALINLGFLYEQGRGVPRDPARALELYRQAAGIDGSVVALESHLDIAPLGAGVRAELMTLRERVAELERETAALESELAGARERLSRALADEATAANDIGARAEAAKRDAVSQRELLQAQREAIAHLRDQLVVMEENLGDRDTEINALQAALADEREVESEVVGRLKSELLAQRAEAQQARRALEQSLARSDARLSEVGAEHAEREKLLNRELRSYMAHLAEREADLARQAEQTDRLLSEVGVLRSELESARAAPPQAALAQQIIAGPSITLIDPTLPSTRAAETRGLVKVRLETSVANRPIIGQVRAPAGLLSLTVNDEPAIPNPAGVFKTEVPVNGETGVHVVAIDQQGKRADLHFAFTNQSASHQDEKRRPISIELGKNHALLIGNNNYRHLPDLLTPINDVRRLAGLLSQRYGFETTTLENANRYEILSALNRLRENLTSGDNLLIYYAGHGELDETNSRGHWLPVDAEANSTANWISNVSVTDILNVMQARQVLLVVDSCYSGTLTRSSIARLDTGMTEAERRTWLEIMARKRARVVLTSGGLAPVLDFGGGEHSVFARALVEVLESNADLLTGRSLHQAVAARVAHAAAGYEFEQLPEYAPIARAGHEAGDFFLLPI